MGERFLYRGVHSGHPGFLDALQGIVRPADASGQVTVRDHNAGGYSAVSPFTSWTTDRLRALYYANRKGPGGLLLIVSTGAPRADEAWQ